MGMIAIGAHGSGKSYSLFGNMDNSSSDGVVPRTIQLIFDPSGDIHASAVLVQMYLVMNEEILDLFDASLCSYKHSGEMAYSASLGSLLMPVNTLVANSVEECLDYIMLGNMAMAAAISNGTNFWSVASLMISLQTFSNKNNRYSRMYFGEIAPLHAPKPATQSVDRFSGQSLAHTSSRDLYNSVKISPALSMPMPVAASTGAAGDKGFVPVAKPPEYQNSVIPYILQDCLYKV
jgi:hypothetical protein